MVLKKTQTMFFFLVFPFFLVFLQIP